jgi:hypothetical protein
MLECCREYGRIKRFINVSTDEVYGETSLGKSEGLQEHSALEPTNPYSAAKAGAEMMVRVRPPVDTPPSLRLSLSLSLSPLPRRWPPLPTFSDSRQSRPTLLSSNPI